MRGRASPAAGSEDWLSMSGTLVTPDSVIPAKDCVHHFISEQAFAEFYRARQRSHAIARIGRRRFDRVEHHAGAIFRSGFGVAAAFVRSAPRAGINFCVVTALCGVEIGLAEFGGGLPEVCDDVAGLDENDFDAKGIEFKPKRIAEAFEGMFAGTVGSIGWRGDKAGDAAGHQNAPAPPFAHVR